MGTAGVSDRSGGNVGGHLDDDNLNERENDNKKTAATFTLINTNARSLCPKIESIIDCMEEMRATVGIITETWLADGPSLNTDIADLRDGA